MIECPPHLWQTARPPPFPQPLFVLHVMAHNPVFPSLARSLSPPLYPQTQPHRAPQSKQTGDSAGDSVVSRSAC